MKIRKFIAPAFIRNRRSRIFRLRRNRINAGAIIFRIFIFEKIIFFSKISKVEIPIGGIFIRFPKTDAALMRPSRYQSQKGAF